MLLVSSSSFIPQPISNNHPTHPRPSPPLVHPSILPPSTGSSTRTVHASRRKKRCSFVCSPALPSPLCRCRLLPPLRRSCSFPPPLQSHVGCSGVRDEGDEWKLFRALGAPFLFYRFLVQRVLRMGLIVFVRQLSSCTTSDKVGMRSLVVRTYLLVSRAATMVKPAEA